MTQTTDSSSVKPFEAIPFAALPEDLPSRMGSSLVSAYQQHGPIFRSKSYNEDGERDIVYLVGPEANQFVLVKNRQKFSNQIGWTSIFHVADMFGRGLLSMDGPEHDQQRKMMNPAFTVSYMDRYLPLMNRVVREHTATWTQREQIDLYDEARRITFAVAAEALTGLKPGQEIDQFRELYLRMLMGDGVTTYEEFVQHRDFLRGEASKLLHPLIEERRAHPGDDVFSLLIHARDPQGNVLSEEQIIAHINILLVAGHETSTSLSAWLLYLLVQHPDYTQRILDEQQSILGSKADPNLEDIKRMKVLENALSEAERLYAPVANGPRGVLEDFDFNGYHVPAGTFLFYSIIGSHLLPHIFADPLKFDPDRFSPPREEHKKVPYSLVGFGGGPRICIGINFAQVEIKTLVSHVLRNYQLELVPNQNIQQVYYVTGAPAEGIRMHVTPRTS